MKNLVAVVLCLILLCGLCSCGKTSTSEIENSEETFDTFSAGFGKVDVTPWAGVHLGSYGDAQTRIAQGVKDRFYALTTVLTDTQGNTLCLTVTDLSWGHITWTEKLRALVEEKYGIPGEYVMLGGTHNHNGPGWTIDQCSEEPENAAYLEFWLKGVMESIDIAMKDRKPVSSMQVGRTETEGVGFVRRYWSRDGVLVSATTTSTTPCVTHESEGDEEVQMVKITRDGGKDILIGQWQNHGCHMGNTRTISTDWMGPMREKVEKELDVHYLYMQGAAGNMATKSNISSEYPEEKTLEEVGHAVADVIVAAYRDENAFTSVNTGTIQTKQETFAEENDPQYRTGWTGELNSIGIGDLAIVTFPVEVFAETGKEVKEGSPYAMTLLMGYTNGIHGYIPTEEAFYNGGYEAGSRGDADTADRFVETYLNSLKSLHSVD